MIKNIILSVCTLFLFFQIHAQILPLIPFPNSIQKAEGTFSINENTIIFADKNSNDANYLQQYLLDNYGLKLNIVFKTKIGKNYIHLWPSISKY